MFSSLSGADTSCHPNEQMILTYGILADGYFKSGVNSDDTAWHGGCLSEEWINFKVKAPWMDRRSSFTALFWDRLTSPGEGKKMKMKRQEDPAAFQPLRLVCGVNRRLTESSSVGHTWWRVTFDRPQNIYSHQMNHGRQKAVFQILQNGGWGFS